jgi:hypothetical protein
MRRKTGREAPSVLCAQRRQALPFLMVRPRRAIRPRSIFADRSHAMICCTVVISVTMSPVIAAFHGPWLRGNLVGGCSGLWTGAAAAATSAYLLSGVTSLDQREVEARCAASSVSVLLLGSYALCNCWDAGPRTPEHWFSSFQGTLDGKATPHHSMLALDPDVS